MLSKVWFANRHMDWDDAANRRNHFLDQLKYEGFVFQRFKSPVDTQIECTVDTGVVPLPLPFKQCVLGTILGSTGLFERRKL